MAERLREASGHLRGWSGAPWNASLPIWRYRRSGRLLQSASPRFAKACGTGSKRRQSAVPQVRAMPCWRACGPARWGRRSSYGNGFAIFSRYVTEPRDFPSESSRPTPDIRLSALIRAIVSPWKGVSEPPSSATVKYRSFSSIPLPCPEEQGDAGGRRRAIARLHRAVPLGMRGDPLRAWGTADRRPCRARFAGRAPRACRRAGGTPRSSGRHVPDLRKADPINNRRFPNS